MLKPNRKSGFLLRSGLFCTKKGLSPLISTLIIIGMAFLLSSLVIIWSTNLTRETIETTDEDLQISSASGKVNVKVTSAGYDGENLVFTVQNDGEVAIDEIIVQGCENLDRINLEDTPDGILNELEIKTYSALCTGVLPGDSLTILPGGDLNDDGSVDFIPASSVDVVVPRECEQGSDCYDGISSTQDGCVDYLCANPYIYFRVFVTGDPAFDGNLGGLAGADSICQQRADGVQINGTWKAWISDVSLNASDRLYHSLVEYRKLDGVKIADDWTDLLSETIPGSGVYLQSPVDVSENGVTVASGDVYVWTGSDVNGIWIPAGDCASWTGVSGTGIAGDLTKQDQGWTYSIDFGCAFPQQRLYCFEQPV